MSFKKAEFNKALREAVESFDRAGVEELCQRLIAHVREWDDAYPSQEAKRVLGLLRKRRYFDLMQRVADAMIQNGQRNPLVRRQYAQSQLDQGSLTAAINVLIELVEDTGPQSANADPEENAEARGLLGRAYKDLYALADDPNCSRSRRFLKAAIDYYGEVYKNDQTMIWHGINSVALIRRAEADDVELDNVAGLRRLADSRATEILAEVERRVLDEKANTWDFATAVEACVGLDQADEALSWLEKYLKSDFTDAFELGSTYRQLTQVWKLNPVDAPGDLILPTLTAALLERQGGEVEIKFDPDHGYEKIFGTAHFQSTKWFKKCLQRAAAVAQVVDSNDAAVGTAFVVRAGDFIPDLGDELLLLTNAHVISSDPDVSRALRPDKAVLKFELWEDGVSPDFNVEALCSSPPGKLDYTLLRPDQPIEDIEAVPVTESLPLKGGEERAYIIGHPGGRKLSFSIQDNYLLDYDDRRLHYRSPTEPGSSGSPVFNGDWELIALHHAGTHTMPKLNDQPGTYAANEGIWIKAIKQHMQDAAVV